MMIFGPKVRYGVTYKTNQKSFDVYKRKYHHDFTLPLNQINMEGAIGMELNKINAFLIANID